MRWERLCECAASHHGSHHRDAQEGHVQWQQPRFVSTIWEKTVIMQENIAKPTICFLFFCCLPTGFRVCRARVFHIFSKTNNWLFQWSLRLSHNHLLPRGGAKGWWHNPSTAVLRNEVFPDTQRRKSPSSPSLDVRENQWTFLFSLETCNYGDSPYSLIINVVNPEKSKRKLLPLRAKTHAFCYTSGLCVSRVLHKGKQSPANSLLRLGHAPVHIWGVTSTQLMLGKHHVCLKATCREKKKKTNSLASHW